jgi:hypothetical protein
MLAFEDALVFQASETAVEQDRRGVVGQRWPHGWGHGTPGIPRCPRCLTPLVPVSSPPALLAPWPGDHGGRCIQLCSLPSVRRFQIWGSPHRRHQQLKSLSFLFRFFFFAVAWFWLRLHVVSRVLCFVEHSRGMCSSRTVAGCNDALERVLMTLHSASYGSGAC